MYTIKTAGVEIDSNFTLIPQLTFQYDTQKQALEHNIGVDLMYRPSADKLLSATVAPDFGTADADELVANFSPIEVFFPENRTFFTEYHSIFDVKDDSNQFVLVNTRRIGAVTDGNVRAPAELEYAGKFVSVGNSLDTGLLYASEKDLGIANGKSFLVARGKAHLEKGYVGTLLTLTDRPEIARKAYTAVVDINLWSEDWLLDGVLIGSRLDEQRRTDGLGFYVDGEYAINRNTNFSAQLMWFDDKLEIDDVGFLERNNIKKLDLSADTTLYEAYDFAPELYLGASTTLRRNFEGEQLASNLNLIGVLTDNDAWEFLAEFNYRFSGIDDLISFGNGSVDLPSQKDIYFEVATPSGNNTQFIFAWNYFQEGLNGWAHAIDPTIRYAFTDSVNIELSAYFQESDDWLIGNGLGQLERFKHSFREFDLKLLWLISQNQEINARFQWNGYSATALDLFDISGRELVAQGRAEDFAESQFSMQVKYRYFFAPLSELIIVYSRQGDFFTDDLSKGKFGHLFERSFRDVREDLLTPKIRYAF